MNSLKKIIVEAALAAVLSLSTAAATQAADVLTMKPLQALSFDVDTKHAVAYFVSQNGACKLAVTLAETPNADDVTNFTTTRFEAAINAGKAARFDASAGKALEFACQADTLAMTVKPVELQIVDAAK